LPPPLPVKTGQKAGELLELTIKGMKWRFRWCPAGTFIMGSPPHEKGRRSNERQHQVTLTQGFWMQETATTQEQWESVMGSNPSQFKGSQFLPVECVSWDDCQEYIDKLNALFPSSYYRFLLPTEAQWEYACRAGSQTVYCCGDSREQLKDYAWYSGNSNYQTHLVGQKKANRWGLYDMHGNVWEWCSDQYGVHPTVSVTNPMTLMRGDSIRLPYYVFRGGDLYGNAENCRSASRDCYIPTVGYDTSGLRLSLVDKIK
jgi:formylglycine-generating enzyme required for sulfatase activity